MSTLADKIRASRIKKVEVEGKTFFIRRPTHAEAATIGAIPLVDVCVEFTVDWEGIRESDLLESGSTDIVPFDKDIWGEYLPDKPELWRPLSSAIIEHYQKHVAKVADSVKK